MTTKKEIKKMAKAIRKKANVGFIESFKIAKIFVKQRIYDIEEIPSEVTIEPKEYITSDGYIELDTDYFINGIPVSEIWDW